MLAVRQLLLLVAFFVALLTVVLAGLRITEADPSTRTVFYAAMIALGCVLMAAGWITKVSREAGTEFTATVLRRLLIWGAATAVRTALLVAFALGCAATAYAFGSKSIYTVWVDCDGDWYPIWTDGGTAGANQVARRLNCGETGNKIWDPGHQPGESMKFIKCLNRRTTEQQESGDTQALSRRICPSYGMVTPTPKTDPVNTPPANPPESKPTSPKPPPRRAICSEEEKARQRVVPGFDAGYNEGRGYVHIDDDGLCDYCRVVGNPGNYRVFCTLATPSGLTGTTFQSGAIDAGYDGTRKWVDQDGVPVFLREVGNNHELTALTPVTSQGIGDTTFRPN